MTHASRRSPDARRLQLVSAPGSHNVKESPRAARRGGVARRVTVVRRPDCAHGLAALTAIKDMADRLGLPVVVEEVLVDSEADARASRCLGSPTILIDGRDVEPSARGRVSFGLT